MSGKALRWHASLDDDVQESWKRLMKAILARYPPADEDAIVPSASAAPVAPTAALPPVAPWPSSFPQVNVAPPAAVPPQSGALKSSSKPSDGASGIIEIQYARTNQSIGYLSETLKFNGAAQVASYRSSAQKVTVNNEPSSTYSNIALDTEPRSRDRFIGITWLQTGGARASAGYRYAAIVFTQGSDGSKSSIDSFWYEGDSEAAIWDIASDGKVTATSGGKPLAFYVYDKTDQINLFPDFNAYISSRGIAHRWDRVNLIFKEE
ncbi:hypothetical protein FRC05_002258 [Tulasnella sp. 425]|nr:hypothetical protein FRC05_002258 [Tulasnella sp. 425]